MDVRRLLSFRAASRAMRAGGMAMRYCREPSTIFDLPASEGGDEVQTSDGFQQDGAKLAGDWRAVGNDLWNAMQDVEVHGVQKQQP